MRIFVLCMIVVMGLNLTGCALLQSEDIVLGERVPADVRYDG